MAGCEPDALLFVVTLDTFFVSELAALLCLVAETVAVEAVFGETGLVLGGGIVKN